MKNILLTLALLLTSGLAFAQGGGQFGNGAGSSSGGVSSVAGTASQIDVTGTTTATVSLDQAFTAQIYGVDNSGSSTAYTVPLPLAWTSNADGKEACFLAANVNTTAAPTVSFNSQTALSIVRFNGGTLAVGDVGNVVPVCGVVKGTNFELMNPQKTTGSGAIVLANSPTFPAAISAVTYTTGTNCAATGTAANPSVAACAAAAAGVFSCATNASGTTCTLNTTAITANSSLVLIQNSYAGTRLSVTCNTTILASTAPLVSSIGAGTATITLPVFSVNPVCFNYWVVD